MASLTFGSKIHLPNLRLTFEKVFCLGKLALVVQHEDEVAIALVSENVRLDSTCQEHLLDVFDHLSLGSPPRVDAPANLIEVVEVYQQELGLLSIVAT